MALRLDIEDYEFFESQHGLMLAFDLPLEVAAAYPDGVSGPVMAFWDACGEAGLPVVRLIFPASPVQLIFKEPSEPFKAAVLAKSPILYCQAGGGELLRATTSVAYGVPAKD